MEGKIYSPVGNLSSGLKIKKKTLAKYIALSEIWLSRLK